MAIRDELVCRPSHSTSTACVEIMPVVHFWFYECNRMCYCLKQHRVVEPGILMLCNLLRQTFVDRQYHLSGVGMCVLSARWEMLQETINLLSFKTS